jgi:N-acyl-D-aspartate/D-glutamate deacylase
MMAARERTSVTEPELNQMKELFYEGMQAGAFGVAGNRSGEDHPEDGSYLPSHVASNEEWLGLSEVMSQFNVGHIGWDIGNVPVFNDRNEQHELLTQMLKVSGRPLHLILGSAESAAWMRSMRAEGFPVIEQIGTIPVDNTFKLAEFNMYDILPSWIDPLVGSPEERMIKLQAPGVRDAMKRGVEELRHHRTSSINTEIYRIDWTRVRVLEVVYDRNQRYQGLTVNEVAQATGKDPVDAFLDLALDEQLQTVFTVPQGQIDPFSEDLCNRVKGPYSHVSVSDGGAHTRYFTSSFWPIYFLANFIRDREVMTIEQAHYKISTYPAWIAGFKDRGMLRVGAWADVMVYEQDKLGLLYEKPVFAYDFPGGEPRFIQKPTGLRYTVVNGTVTFEGNDGTGALPGKLLRSYDMVG